MTITSEPTETAASFLNCLDATAAERGAANGGNGGNTRSAALYSLLRPLNSYFLFAK